MLTGEHVSTQSTLAHEQISTQGTLARDHIFSTQVTQFSRLIIRFDKSNNRKVVTNR